MSMGNVIYAKGYTDYLCSIFTKYNLILTLSWTERKIIFYIECAQIYHDDTIVFPSLVSTRQQVRPVMSHTIGWGCWIYKNTIEGKGG